MSGPAHALEAGSWFSRVCVSHVAAGERSCITCAWESHAELAKTVPEFTTRKSDLENAD